MGHPTAWIGNPDVRPPEDIIRMEPETGWRGGGPLCPLRWMFHRESPQRWATQPPGSEIPMCVPPKTSSEWNRRQGGGGAQRGLGCMRFGCSAGRLPSDASPAERTQRSAPPRPVGWPLAMLVFGGGSSGFFDSGVWVAPWDGCPLIQTQWSGHRGLRSRDPFAGPLLRSFFGGEQRGSGRLRCLVGEVSRPRRAEHCRSPYRPRRPRSWPAGPGQGGTQSAERCRSPSIQTAIGRGPGWSSAAAARDRSS